MSNIEISPSLCTVSYGTCTRAFTAKVTSKDSFLLTKVAFVITLTLGYLTLLVPLADITSYIVSSISYGVLRHPNVEASLNRIIKEVTPTEKQQEALLKRINELPLYSRALSNFQRYAFNSNAWNGINGLLTKIGHRLPQTRSFRICCSSIALTTIIAGAALGIRAMSNTHGI